MTASTSDTYAVQASF